MMSGNQVDFGDAANVVDWDAHNQSQAAPYQNNQNADSTDNTYKNITYTGTAPKQNTGTINTFLGALPNDAVKKAIEEGKNPETYKEAIDLGVGGGGMELAGKAAKPIIKKGIEYLQPEKKAQELISSLGEGTSKDVIEEIGKRLQFGKQSATEEALIPKRKLYDEFGEERLFSPKLKYAESNIYEAPESRYLSQKNVTDPYSSNGKLQSLHDAFENNPVLNTYDPLSSALKKELRIQEKAAKSGSDIARQKADQLNINIKNLEADAKNVISKLPDEYKNLDLEWRKKYATGVPKYEESSKAIDKLSSGNWQEVNADQVIKSFIYDNKKTREVLKDIGPSSTKNFLYLALQKTGAEDAEALGKKILELKNTKGFDKFIDKDLEDQANRLIKQNKRANLIKKAIKVSAGASAGGLIGGPIGAVTGAALPFGKDAFNLALKKYRK